MKIEQNKKQTNNLEGILVNMTGEPTLQSKFIVCTTEKPNQLEFYCANKNIYEFHKKIADANRVPRSRVVGGGYFILEDNILTVNKDSRDFGPVPKEIAENFANTLVNYLAKKYGQNVEKVNVNVESNFHKPKQREYWAKKGFQVLNPSQTANEIMMLYLPVDIDTQGLNLVMQKDKKKFSDYLSQLPKYENLVEKAQGLVKELFSDKKDEAEALSILEKMNKTVSRLNEKDEVKLTSEELDNFHSEYCKLSNVLNKAKEKK
ncbi:MAG: hypothetical protein KKE23_02270 [Nanoarchaeota archaeon]|nr:hypothetical protein [Nanoarchaeota archaeon]